jgi:cytochrome c oxidase subunit 2
MIEYLVPQASTFADDIDNLFLTVCVIVGVWYLLTKGMFLWLVWRFRAKEGVAAEYITGKEPHLKRWITWPHALIILCDVVLIVGAVRVWYMVKQDMPEAADTVRITGQQWAWTFQHSGPDGVLDTEDDITLIDELHVKANTLYHFELQSMDVLHNFAVPAFRLRQDTIPGRVIRGWFEPTLPGEYDIECAEICGIGHGIMGARVFVHSPEQHTAWLNDHSGSQLAGL